jgi:hypothetical protein
MMKKKKIFNNEKKIEKKIISSSHLINKSLMIFLNFRNDVVLWERDKNVEFNIFICR